MFAFIFCPPNSYILESKTINHIFEGPRSARLDTVADRLSVQRIEDENNSDGMVSLPGAKTKGDNIRPLF